MIYIENACAGDTCPQESVPVKRPSRDEIPKDSFLGRLIIELKRAGLNQRQLAKAVEISPNTVSGWFSKNRYLPQPRILNDIARVLKINPQWLISGTHPREVQISRPNARLIESSPTRPYGNDPVVWVPVISWAQAGIAANYERIPEDWQERIPIPTSDKKAFAIKLRGDSMEPKYQEGDLVIVLPSIFANNGDLVVANIKDEGFAFKILNLIGGDPDKIRLKSYNPLYDPMEYSRDDFHWIYPVDSVTKRVRK